MQPTPKMVERFLTWPVPASVYPDGTPGVPGRTGTNLLTAEQARDMLAYVLAAEDAPQQDDAGDEAIRRYCQKLERQLAVIEGVAESARIIREQLEQEARARPATDDPPPAASTPAGCQAKFYNRIGFTSWRCSREACLREHVLLPEDRQWPCGAHPPSPAPAVGVRASDDVLEQLACRWEHRVRCTYASAATMTGMERRAVEHGAMCYANCATELREAIRTGASLRWRAMPSTDRS